MQGHILLQHSWILGLRMPSGCLSFWMDTLLSHVSFILRQALFMWVPDSHDQVFSVQVIPTKVSEFTSICPVLCLIPSPGPNSVTLIVETRVTHPSLSEWAREQEFERGIWMEYRQGAVAAQQRKYPTFKVRSSSCEGIHQVQGQERQLCFAGAAVKRYPTSKVRETQVKMVGAKREHQRADRLKPQSQRTSQSDHMDHSLV